MLGEKIGKQRRTPWWRCGWRWVRGRFCGLRREATRKESSLDPVLHQITLQVQETLEEKTGLFAAVVHDLKTPLLGIRQLAEIVLEEDTLSEDGRRKLELIRASADEAMGRVDRLLSAADDEMEVAPEWGTVDVRELVEQVMYRFQPHAEYKAQSLRCSLPDASCRIEGDELRLQEAVSNLMSNALKYSPRGETIEVQVTCSGGEVRISVSDNGPGLSESDQNRLFSPFQQLTPRPTGNESSSGVGLYVTKQIMNLHEGAVEVVTAEGEGSTFTLVLPRTTSSGGARRSASESKASGAASFAGE